VTHAFDSAKSSCGLRNHQSNWVAGDSKIITETASTGDAWIRQRTQPLPTQKSSTRMLPRVTHALDSANSPCGLRNVQRKCFHGWRMHSTAQTARAASEIFNETASTSDACIRQRKQPLWHQTSSTKMILRVTHGFDSANSPCGLRNLQRKWFHGWRMDSTAQTAPAASEIFNETASWHDQKIDVFFQVQECRSNK